MTPTPLEGRLTTALSARANQVTAADLRPPAPPTGPRRSGHRWLLASVALAAAFLSVAVFVLIGQVREAPVRPSDQPRTASPSPTEPTPAPATETAVPSPSGPANPPLPATPSRSESVVPPPEVTPRVTVRPIPPTTSGPGRPTATAPGPRISPTDSPAQPTEPVPTP